MRTIPLIAESYWMVGLSAFSAGGVDLCDSLTQPCRAIVDSGTSFIGVLGHCNAHCLVAAGVKHWLAMTEPNPASCGVTTRRGGNDVCTLCCVQGFPKHS